MYSGIIIDHEFRGVKILTFTDVIFELILRPNVKIIASLNSLCIFMRNEVSISDVRKIMIIEILNTCGELPGKYTMM